MMVTLEVDDVRLPRHVALLQRVRALLRGVAPLLVHEVFELCDARVEGGVRVHERLVRRLELLIHYLQEPDAV